jgi:hypothetical protein
MIAYLEKNTHCSKEELPEARSERALQQMKRQSNTCLKALTTTSLGADAGASPEISAVTEAKNDREYKTKL